MTLPSAILFGGSGFVGTHLRRELCSRSADRKIYIVDIVRPGNLGPQEIFIEHDVRKPFLQELGPISEIYNLAAVHRSPGHDDPEYFETNILGARHICEFARREKVRSLVFTSSISVYGPSEERKAEDSIPCPSIAYGSSKIIAEHIHREWALTSPGARLSIFRPAVIFGKGENGNFTRLANMVQKGVFIYPGRTDTVKSCVYVKDVARILSEAARRSESGISTLNLCYPEAIQTQTIVKCMKQVLRKDVIELRLPLALTKAAIYILHLFVQDRTSSLHAERVVKLLRSTHIDSNALREEGYELHYPLGAALEDWFQECAGDHRIS